MAKKAAQTEANYREAETPEQVCGTCTNYSPPENQTRFGSCQLVEGQIDPTFVSDLYEPIEGTAVDTDEIAQQLFGGDLTTGEVA
jgi:hypothetical protein